MAAVYQAQTPILPVVIRKAYLGETIDYRIAVGQTEVRVQKTRRLPGPGVGRGDDPSKRG